MKPQAVLCFIQSTRFTCVQSQLLETEGWKSEEVWPAYSQLCIASMEPSELPSQREAAKIFFLKGHLQRIQSQLS